MNRTLSISPKVEDPAFRGMTFDEARAAYEDQVRGLVDGGADVLLLETIFDTLNAKAGIVAIENVFEEKGRRLPLFISVTVTDLSGRTLSGQTLDAFYTSIRHARPLALGINCALGAREMRPHLEELARLAECFVLCYPNAGLPNAFGQYDQLPDETGELLQAFVTGGLVNSSAAAAARPPITSAPSPKRSRVWRRGRCRRGAGSEPTAGPGSRPIRPSTFSGLETLTILPDSNFQMIGERTNVTGSAKFARLIKSQDYSQAAHVAAEQVRNGANIVDVNMDEGMLDSEQAMTTFLNYIATEPEIARVPIMIDSSKWSVIEAGLKCVQGKGIVNSISLKEGEADFLHKAQTRAALRRRRGRDGVRRSRAGGHDRAQGADLPACLHAADRAGRVRSHRHHLRPQHPGDRDRPRGAQRLRDQLHRGDAPSSRPPAPASRSAAASATSRSRSAATTSCARRFTPPSSSTPSRPAWTWASSTPGSWRSTRTSRPELLEHVEDIIFNRRPDATERMVQFAEQVKGAGKEEGGGPRVAAGHGRGAAVVTRWSTAWSTSSRPTSRKRGRNTSGRSRSSRAR